MSNNNIIELDEYREEAKPNMLGWRNFFNQELKGCSSIQQIEHIIVKHMLIAKNEKDANQSMYGMLAILDVLKVHSEINGEYYGI